ncbi:MAG: LOG family protein [Vulcanimicrobiota bacterium]
MPRLEFESLEKLDNHLAAGGSLENTVCQSLDLRGRTQALMGADLRGAVFLGCLLEPVALAHALNQGSMLFPRLPELPYDPYRGFLYTVEELLEPGELEQRLLAGDENAYDRTLDGLIYEHWEQTGRERPPDILDALGRRLHDHAITDAMEELLEGREVVAMMGGHSLGRDHPDYFKVALLSRRLTQEGFFMISGGGPGAMEATHLGALFVDRGEDELAQAVAALESAPTYRQKREWLLTGIAVRRRYPPKDPIRAQSLGIPTWLYGHEPPNLFASHVAKYFANSVREDGLVTVAGAGIVFAPGNAGTVQEIFQDNTQNYYMESGPSPMILFGEDYWKWRKPVYPLLCSLANGKKYEYWLSITDSVAVVVDTLLRYRYSRV